MGGDLAASREKAQDAKRRGLLFQALRKNAGFSTQKAAWSYFGKADRTWRGYESGESDAPRELEIALQLMARKGAPTVSVPIYRRIPAGPPEQLEDEPVGWRELDGLNPHDRHFLVFAAGESMEESLIFDGDLVLCRYQPTAESGEEVAASLSEQGTTLKRLRYNRFGAAYLEGDGEIEIHPEPGEELRIVGKVVRVIREYEARRAA